METTMQWVFTIQIAENVKDEEMGVKTLRNNGRILIFLNFGKCQFKSLNLSKLKFIGIAIYFNQLN